MKEPDANHPQNEPVRPGAIWWLTGYSGAGKTTLGRALVRELEIHGCRAILLDGDVLRAGLSRDLGYDDASRRENIRRASELAASLAGQGVDAVVCLISPFAADRTAARQRAPAAFHEIFVDAPLEVCRQRDPKGLYRRAVRGQLQQLTGFGSDYEAPAHPDLRIDTGGSSIEESLQILLRYVGAHVS